MKRFFTVLLIVAGSVLIGGIIWLASKDRNILVERSIIIHQPVNQVWQTISNLENLPQWSPWLALDSSAKKIFSKSEQKVVTSLKWDSNLFGSGTISITKLHENDYVELKTKFSKPYRATSTHTWQLKAIDSTTMVTWTIKKNIPFFFRFANAKTAAILKVDIERGLKMLRELSENGQVNSEVFYKGIVSAPAITYIGRKNKSSMSDMIPKIKIQFLGLLVMSKQQKIKVVQPMTVYYKFDFTNDNIEFSPSLKVKPEVKIKSKTFEKRKIESGKYIKVVYKGNYEHLLNGWMAAFIYAKKEKVKISKVKPAYELYQSNSKKEGLSSSSIISDIYLPVEE
jgi:uncharacterized membrane protein/predicted transcriptional regulator YdeE